MFLTVEEKESTTTLYLKEAQRRNFSWERDSLETTATVDKQSNLSLLTPLLNTKGVVWIGRRLEEANIPKDMEHPVLPPYNYTITRLVMTDIHIKSLPLAHMPERTIQPDKPL